MGALWNEEVYFKYLWRSQRWFEKFIHKTYVANADGELRVEVDDDQQVRVAADYEGITLKTDGSRHLKQKTVILEVSHAGTVIYRFGDTFPDGGIRFEKGDEIKTVGKKNSQIVDSDDLTALGLVYKQRAQQDPHMPKKDGFMKALSHFKMAAADGHPNAQVQIGRMFEFGWSLASEYLAPTADFGWGVQQNLDEALEWYKKALYTVTVDNAELAPWAEWRYHRRHYPAEELRRVQDKIKKAAEVESK